MGCICSKATGATDDADVLGRSKVSRKFSKHSVLSFKKGETAPEPDCVDVADGHARLIQSPQENALPSPVPLGEVDKKEIRTPVVSRRSTSTRDYKVSIDNQARSAEQQTARIFPIPNGVDGELIAAGWPSWLTSVAGEAVWGWAPRKADSFEKLEKIGQGTYSSVYKARDLETGKIVALKKVRFVNMDPESVRFMAREIHILRRLDHPNIIKLEALVTSRMSCSLYLVFEYMEHDLAGLQATPGIKFSEAQVKCYMKQLLLGLEHCHNHGVLHRDIKGSNLLIDNNGNLRIGDFGLATFFSPSQTQPLTSRVVTLWYRPPELLLGATEYGVAVDMWSSGCILAELLAGKPIMPGRTEVEQLHKIFKLCGSPSEDYWKKSKLPHATIFKPQQPYKRRVSEAFKDFPPSALTLLDVLLAIEPSGRRNATSALASEFFTTKPLPCDPSNLPKYPPSKEFDAKLREEEARKQRAALKGRGSNSIARRPGDSMLVPAADVIAEAQQDEPNPRIIDARHPSHGTLNHPKGNSANRFSHSGPLYHPSGYGTSWNNNRNLKEDEIRPAFASARASSKPELRAQKSCMPETGSNLNHSSRGAALKSNAKSANRRVKNNQWPEQRDVSVYDSLDSVEHSEHHLLEQGASSRMKTERIMSKETTASYISKKNRIHYSGPLFPAGGNMDELLKEHERQIQQAVRKARLEKVKTKKKYGEMALLCPNENSSDM